MNGVRIRDWRWWWGIMGNYWLEVGHMIWSPYEVYPDLWSPQPPPPTYRRHPAHDDAVSGDDTAIDPMTTYMTAPRQTPWLTPWPPRPNPCLTQYPSPWPTLWGTQGPALRLTPRPIAWLAPSTTPRSRPWLWSWPKVENCDFRAVLSYWSCKLPYFFFLLQITLQPLWAQNGFSLSGLSNGKFPHNVSSQWIFLDTLDEIYPL